MVGYMVIMFYKSLKEFNEKASPNKYERHLLSFSW